ncbi:MAG: Clp protease N-terminal domain-containing protein, partial [Clostridiaceae bacterium]
MNVNKLTQKSREAVQAAQQNASERGNTEVSQLHLLGALLEQPDGLIPSLLSGM